MRLVVDSPIESGAVNSGISSLSGYLPDEVIKPVRVIEPAITYPEVIQERDLTGSNKAEAERVITPAPEYVPIIQTYQPAAVTDTNRDEVKIEPAINYSDILKEPIATKPIIETVKPTEPEPIISIADKYKEPDPEPVKETAPEVIIEPAKTITEPEKPKPFLAIAAATLASIPIIGAIFGGGTGSIQKYKKIEPAKSAGVQPKQSNTTGVMVTLLILGIGYFLIRKYKK